MRRRSRPPRDHQRRPERHIASLGDKGRPHPFVTTEPCLNRRLELWNVLRSLAAAHVRSAGDRAYVRARCALRARAVPLLSLHQAEPGRSPDGNPDGKLGPVRAGPEPGTRMPGRRHWVRRTQVLEKGFTPDGSGPGALTLLGSAVQLRWSASKQAMTTAKQPSIMQLLAVATTIQSINGQMIHMGKVQISK